MLKDYVIYIFRNFTHRKIRGWLTILGILIGVAAVIALISVSMGMQDAITQQFESFGTNKIIITPGAGGAAGLATLGYTAKKLTKDDLEVVKKVRGVDMATEMLTRSGVVKFGTQTKYTFVIGMPTDESGKLITDIGGFTAEFGRDLKSGDKYATTVGYLIGKNNELFDKAVKIGNKLSIEGQDFKVVGIIKKIGNKGDDTQVYIPIETARQIFNEKTDISFIYVQTKEGTDTKDVAEDIKTELRKFRDEKKGEESFSIQTFEQLLAQVNTILGIVGIVLIAISAISLIVGGVGIMNSMYTSVLERTHEIGVMKAIGARNEHVLAIFMIESGIYGVIGGSVGIILGLGMAKIAELAAMSQGIDYFKASITPGLILGGLAFSFLIGCISGVAPARSASMMKPVEALRYE
jgi:putative ABC transport system permease protein